MLRGQGKLREKDGTRVGKTQVILSAGRMGAEINKGTGWERMLVGHGEGKNEEDERKRM